MATYLVGIDEAGRGPLAGPVAVGVFVALPGFRMRALKGIRDSKTLSEAEREAWYAVLTTLPRARYAVAMTSAAVIDRIGIVPAVERALSRALASVDVSPTSACVLLDGGLHAPALYTMQRTIIHGDATEPLISAAAILAKVTRDRYMVRLARQYPAYGFAVHKGYGTLRHREAVRTHGLSPLHRASFCKAWC